jgi:metal-dependent HD superfamily phosphatase/phosphodiesterase
MYNQTHRDTHTQRSADVCERERAERVTDYIQSSSELIARKSYQSKSLIKAIYAHTHIERRDTTGEAGPACRSSS